MTPSPFRGRTPAAVAAAFAAGLGVGFWAARRPPAAPPAPLPGLSWAAGPGGGRVDRPERLPEVPVLSVVDGDTLHILWEGRPVKLRYYGVNTPERDEPCYREATARNRALAGGAVRLGFDERTEDKYGRLLAYAFTPDGRSIDAALTAEGLGRAWRRDGRFRGPLVRLEDGARESRTGCLWSDARPAPPRPSRRRKKGATAP